ncbi:hypothetical protein HFO53_08050 [Rhizobium laguerreae]|nr:hypothetical protein [Rhizobium laguerreae]MBY3195565.1 hypothetical protein [Rhizobium laguerreae]MBY3229870.1 hypothetical protein [Rhizobium laguerreae]MBY3559310.1 hypothetical protein [Rhizobium laguerreae]
MRIDEVLCFEDVQRFGGASSLNSKKRTAIEPGLPHVVLGVSMGSLAISADPQINHCRAKLEEFIDDPFPATVVGFYDRCYRGADRLEQMIERRVAVGTAACSIAVADLLKLINDLPHDNLPIDSIKSGRIHSNPFEISDIHHGTPVPLIVTDALTRNAALSPNPCAYIASGH